MKFQNSFNIYHLKLTEFHLYVGLCITAVLTHCFMFLPTFHHYLHTPLLNNVTNSNHNYLLILSAWTMQLQINRIFHLVFYISNNASISAVELSTRNLKGRLFRDLMQFALLNASSIYSEYLEQVNSFSIRQFHVCQTFLINSLLHCS